MSQKNLTQQFKFPGLSFLVVFISGVVIAIKIEQSCEYHEPIQKAQSWLFTYYFSLNNGHPIASNHYWVHLISVASFLGLVPKFILTKHR